MNRFVQGRRKTYCFLVSKQNMDNSELEQWVTDVIVNLIPDVSGDVENDSTFDEDGLDADSLSVVEIMYSVNDEFGIETDDENIGEIETVEDLKLYIITHSDEFDHTDAEQLDLDQSRLKEIEKL